MGPHQLEQVNGIYNISILIAEDEPTILEALSLFFRRKADRVFCAKDGAEALAIFENNDINIVFSDIRMPNMDGLELVRRIREIDADLPVVILSGHYEKEMLIEAIDYNITAFLSKPAGRGDVLKALERCYILIEAKRLKQELEAKNLSLQKANQDLQAAYDALRVAKQNELQLLEYKDKYHTWQEENAFKKQLKLIRDDMCKLYDESGIYFSGIYEPKDILSGDSYGTIRIDEGRYFLYILDSMGKGLAASLTSMVVTSYINNFFDAIKDRPDYAFEKAVRSFFDFARKQVLKDEIMGAFFLEVDKRVSYLQYAGFGSPPLYVEYANGEIEEVLSNNPPIRTASEGFETGCKDLGGVHKLVFFSDAMLEAELRDNSGTYLNYMKEDIKNAFCANDFYKFFSNRTQDKTDDITLLFLRFCDIKHYPVERFEIDDSVSEAEAGLDRVIGYLSDYVEKMRLHFFRSALQEILTNAIEHGSLGLSSDIKRRLIYKKAYENFIDLSHGKDDNVDKKITVQINKKELNGLYCFAVFVEDQGGGFDICETIKELKMNEKNEFSGRGLRVSELYTQGLYFNKTGNKAVLFVVQKKLNMQRGI